MKCVQYHCIDETQIRRFEIFKHIKMGFMFQIKTTALHNSYKKALEAKAILPYEKGKEFFAISIRPEII